MAGLLPHAVHNADVQAMLVAVVACDLFFHMNGLHASLAGSSMRSFLIDIADSAALGLTLSLLALHIIPSKSSEALWVLGGGMLASLVPLMLRPALVRLIQRKTLVDNILIVGTGELAGKLYRALTTGPRHWSGAETQDGSLIEFPQTPAAYSAVVNCKELEELTLQERISRVIIAETDAQRRAALATALVDCRLRGVRVSDAVDFYERLSGKIWLDGLRPEWLVYTDGFDRSRLTVCLKRCLDVVAAALLIVLSAPLLALISLAIRLNSKGTVLFRQVRVGQGGKPFVLYKFRSMREDAESRTGPVWAGEKDPRVTPVGEVLRKFRLDEIPQAFNVLRGEMSFVGPRPERPYFVNLLKQRIPFYDHRHSVKPGITGWAQVQYRYGASVQDAYEKLQYDLHYAKHMSLQCDARILLKTLAIVIFGRGR